MSDNKGFFIKIDRMIRIITVTSELFMLEKPSLVFLFLKRKICCWYSTERGVSLIEFHI